MHDMTLVSRFDRPVSPSLPNPKFEDSILFAWLDPEGSCGFARVGQNVTAGRQSGSFGMSCQDDEFHAAQYDIAMGCADRSDTGMTWRDALSIEMADASITVCFPGCSGRLSFSGSGQRFDYFRAAGLPPTDLEQAGHFVVAGRLHGELLLGDRTVVVDALGFRDRAWGPRDWSNLREVRWQQAVFDEELYVSVATMTWISGRRQAFGFAVIDGVPLTLHSPFIEIGGAGAGLIDHVAPGMAFEAAIVCAGLAEERLRHEPIYEVPAIIGGQPATQRLGIAEWRGRKGMSLIEHVVMPDVPSSENETRSHMAE